MANMPIFEEIIDQAQTVDNKIQDLRQRVIFVETNYNFYHKDDNHLEVLKKQREICNDTENICSDLNEKCYNFEDLLIKAKQLSEQLDNDLKTISEQYNIDLNTLSNESENEKPTTSTSK